MKEFKILLAYSEMFWSDKTYFLISGGRASGKSTQVAAYFLLKLIRNEYFRGVISRFSAKSIKFSIYQDVLDLAEQWGILSDLKINGEEIVYPSNGNKIITHSFKIQEGTQVAKGKGLSRVTHLIIDEAQELPSEEEYIKVIDTFRTKGAERKIFIVFNPGSKLHWLHKRFYIDGKPNPKWSLDHCFIHTTYLDNIDNLDPKKVLEWERSRIDDPEYYRHHILGEWRPAYEGQIFSDWHFEWPQWDAQPVWGLDWGFSNDPTAVVEVRLDGNRVKLREVLYETALTNRDIYDKLIKEGLNSRSTLICDSAEPKSIEELRQLGLNGATNAHKPPGSVIGGIKKLKSFEVWCHPDSKNLIDEYNSYRWKPNSDQPIDSNNHLMDAIRYALSKSTKGKYLIS